ncbi:MAG: type II toxin-antitoxin system prevent-host-death family antitoxin [Gemmatimonadota bacterium]|nr:type II toxin-antitoxin system prevent-host-death family antitoxin [Gemmatimonadota bacterium]
MPVGIRELKAKLSEYVSRAANGELIVVTDRGRPVARLVGLESASVIERGVEEGWITPASRTRLPPAQRFSAPRSIADVLDEDRG